MRINDRYSYYIQWIKVELIFDFISACFLAAKARLDNIQRHQSIFNHLLFNVNSENIQFQNHLL